MRSTLLIKFVFLLILLSGAAGTAGSYINQTSVVPTSTVAWLIASALIGFVAVANRRNV
ncbi:EPS-associated small membrane protein EppA [Pseudomonas citronellolis]|uniref:EPS-associated small membrane protein EppA n=1 Tax=Pseudomonas citronellolis TaxID=53408 RepID=UPI003D332285